MTERHEADRSWAEPTRDPGHSRLGQGPDEGARQATSRRHRAVAWVVLFVMFGLPLLLTLLQVLRP